MTTDTATQGSAGSMLVSAGTAFTGASGDGYARTVRVIQVIGTTAPVINTHVGSSGHANLDGVTLPLGSVTWTDAEALSVTSGLAIVYFGRNTS